MNGTIKVFHQILVSLFKKFESNSLFCNNCHSLYFWSITVTVAMVRAMGCDMQWTTRVHFHPIHVATNTLLSRSVIDSVINLVLAVPIASLVWLDPLAFLCREIIAYSTSALCWPCIATESDNLLWGKNMGWLYITSS